MPHPAASTSESKEEKKRKKKEKEKKKKQASGSLEDGVDVDQMDADLIGGYGVDIDNEEEEWDGTEEMRKKKLDDYMEELYKLEFNDLVSHLSHITI